MGSYLALSRTVSTDRRRSPRVVPERPLQARADGVDADLTVLEVSFGGFRVEGPIPFGPEATHRFQIVPVTGGAAIEFQAKAVYCHSRGAEAAKAYETGFAFLEIRLPATQASVHALMDALTAVLQFD
jgi:PilZ domain-containing protein